MMTRKVKAMIATPTARTRTATARTRTATARMKTTLRVTNSKTRMNSITQNNFASKPSTKNEQEEQIRIQ